MDRVSGICEGSSVYRHTLLEVSKEKEQKDYLKKKERLKLTSLTEEQPPHTAQQTSSKINSKRSTPRILYHQTVKR